MKPGGRRLRTVLAAAATSVVAVAFLVAWLVGNARLSGLEGPAAEIAGQAFRTALAVGAVVALVLAAFALRVIGGRLAGPLERLRADIDAIRSGERAAPAELPYIAEHTAVASAVERLAAERDEQIRELNRHCDELAQLLNSVSEGILRVGPDGRLVHANPAARKLLGIPESAIGQPLASVVRHGELRASLEKAAGGNIVAATEVSIDERRLIVTARPLPDTGGNVVAFVDLTELRRLEGVRRDFVANVSHELKTPLTSIRGYVETLMTDEHLPAEMRRQFLDVIQKNADRLQGIVDDLLDLSRLESGGWRPVLLSVDPIECAAEVWATSAQQAKRQGIRFQTSGESVLVLADPGGLRQVLGNLFDNALRHTSEDGLVRVSVRAVGEGCPPIAASGNGAAAPAAADGTALSIGAPGRSPSSDPGARLRLAEDATAVEPPCVLIEVTDTGSGIPRDALPRIFERFYRVDPARSRAEGGTGLGLSIVKHLIESMGGSVAAESNLGKGTTIRIHLPAA